MKFIGVDVEARGLRLKKSPVWILSLSDGKKHEIYHNCNGLTAKDIPAKVKQVLEDSNVCKIIHRSIYDIPMIREWLGANIVNVWDSENCEVIIQGMRFTTTTKNIEAGSALDILMTRHNVQLKYVLKRYGLPVPKKEIREQYIDRPYGKPFTKDELTYPIDDVKSLVQLQKIQQALLIREGMLPLAQMENLAAIRYADIKYRGIGFDKKRWGELADFYGAEYRRRLAKLPKDVANWGSEKQVKEYFKRKGIIIPSYKVLDEVYLATRNKTLGEFMLTQELKKAVTSYGWSWFKDTIGTDGKVKPHSDYVDPDGRIRCDYTQSINTGRNSSSDPNLQQLPGKGNTNLVHLYVMSLIRAANKVDKIEWRHREAFVPAKGNVFIDLDFGGQEIGIMAAMADEQLWINAMLRSEDVHALTAYTIDPDAWQATAEKGCTFPKKCKCEGHKDLREPAKINNFRLSYGGGSASFGKATGRNIIDATAYVAAHKRAIPSLSRKLEINGNLAVREGKTYSADPYKRRFNLIAEEAWQYKNKGKNYPIQGAGANMLKLALASLPMFIPVVCVIHDQVIVECKKAEAPKFAKICKKVMEDAAAYITGIKGLVKVEPEIKMNIMKG
jgi:DNA polymerase I-like protein with 3'-5' exonuclease and polymerase domains